uniref:Uncharacterized protein n=1 Tax=Romanomermis culicivorax TaxID=13658 RepID=A0A915IZE7_ROMCU
MAPNTGAVVITNAECEAVVVLVMGVVAYIHVAVVEDGSETGRVNLVHLFTLRLMMRGSVMAIMIAAIVGIAVLATGLVSFTMVLVIALINGKALEV